MRVLFLIICFAFSGKVQAQPNEAIWKIRVKQLDEALLNKDSAIIFRLLHEDLSFAHSNGWVQSRSDIWADFRSGRLSYTQLVSDSIRLTRYAKDRATITYRLKAGGTLGNKNFNLTLAVMQVWVRDKKVWKLYARQSAKVE